MSSVFEIEAAIQHLPDDELKAFRQWFRDFDGERWDRQFADDVYAGRLDALGEEALRDLREGRCKEL